MAPYSIIDKCSHFITSPTVPLYKALPSVGDGFRKIKIRKKEKHDLNYEKFLDESFEHERKDLRLRSVLAHTSEPTSFKDNEEIFYIFPPNGYKVLFSENIADHKQYVKELTNTLKETPTVNLLLKSLFQSAYRVGTVQEAAKNRSDVVIYNIQYYYAIRKSIITDYSDFIIS